MDLLPFGHEGSPSGEVWDAFPARGKGDRLWGCAPFAAPLASPPKHPAGRSYQFPWSNEGTRLELRELPSLAALGQAISLRAA